MSRPTAGKLPEIYKELGSTRAEVEERVLPSICNEVLKAVVAQYAARELITMREAVSRKIREELKKRADEYNIILDDVSLTHTGFGQKFTQSIEEKQVALQEAERAKWIAVRNGKEAEASVIRSEGEAAAAEIIQSALAAVGPGLVELRRIQAAKEMAENLSRNGNVVYLPEGGPNGGGAPTMLMQMPQ